METLWFEVLQADTSQSTICSPKTKGIFLFVRVMPHAKACQIIVIGWINR